MDDRRQIDGVTEHFRRLERLYHSAPCNEYYRPQLTVGERSATLRIEVQPAFLNGNGTLHGSVYFKALDDVAAFAVYSVEEMVVPTTAFTIYFLAPMTSGTLVAVGRVVAGEGRTYIVEAEASCGGQVVARGSGSYFRTNTPLTSQPGYGD